MLPRSKRSLNQVLQNNAPGPLYGTGRIGFTGDFITNFVGSDVRCDLFDYTAELVPDNPWRFYSASGPIVPFDDMHVGSAYASKFHTDPNVSRSERRHFHIEQVYARCGPRFNNGFQVERDSTA